MLGCHEFCGYYEWTFHYVRRRWGQQAVAQLWAEAIGRDSQRHYADAGRESGLRGLYGTWVKTGEDEACDWTFTLDEGRNVLRWDMRQCPSKGFLIARDRNADEDYCDHCMGWMIPLLKEIGVEVWEHEHNHLGQCWGTMKMRDRPSEDLAVPHDIRLDDRWNHGYLDRWEHDTRLPMIPEFAGSLDSCEQLERWFAGVRELRVIPCLSDCGAIPESRGVNGGLMTAPVFAKHGDLGLAPLAVLLGHDAADMQIVASRYRETAAQQRPLLLHPYFPRSVSIDWNRHGLPRPVPLLPLLIRRGCFEHRPGQSPPSEEDLLIALARALGKPFAIDGGAGRE